MAQALQPRQLVIITEATPDAFQEHVNRSLRPLAHADFDVQVRLATGTGQHRFIAFLWVRPAPTSPDERRAS